MPIVDTLRTPKEDLLDVYRDSAKSEFAYVLRTGGYRTSVDLSRDVCYVQNSHLMIHEDVLKCQTKSTWSKTPWLHLDVGPDITDIGLKNATSDSFSHTRTVIQEQ